MKRLFAPAAAMALLVGVMIGPAVAGAHPHFPALSAPAGPLWTENGHAVDDADLVFMTDAAVAEYRVAHAGTLSPKDGCHKLNTRVDGKKVTVERHWHHEGTADRGGPCVGRPGFQLTDHGLCAKERIAFARAKEKNHWRTDYKSHAEALKDCVIRMKPRPKRGG